MKKYGTAPTHLVLTKAAYDGYSDDFVQGIYEHEDQDDDGNIIYTYDMKTIDGWVRGLTAVEIVSDLEVLGRDREEDFL